MEPPSSDEEVKPEKLEEVKAGGPSFHCNLFDAQIVYKIAEALLPGLASACVDNTMGGLFKSPASVAVDIRREMVDYLFQRSENFVAESVVLEGGPDAELSDPPYDIISDFIDDFASSKRNMFSRVSGWLLSDRREDRIDDFVQEMEINGFWLLGRREAVAQTLLKNIDFKNTYHCDVKFMSAEELAEHISCCSFRIMDCMNEGCNSRFTAAQMNYHDSICPFKVIPCEQKCTETIMRRDMDRHCITVCPMKLVNCPLYAVGCQCTIPRSTIDQHHLEYLHSHLLYILKSLHREASLHNLKKRVEELEKLSSPGQLLATCDARSLTYVVKDLEANLGPLEVGKAGEEDAELNDLEEEKTKLQTKIEEPTKEHLESPTNDIESMRLLSLSKLEENRNSLDEKEDSPTKHIGNSDSLPGKHSVSPSKQEDNTKLLDGKEESPTKNIESTNSSPRKHSVSPSKQEESINSLDEKEESPTKPIESTDSSPGKHSISPSKQEQSRKSLDEKEESPTKPIESTDSLPGKFSVSPSKQEERRKSLDEKVNDSSLVKDKYPESPRERDLLMEPHTKKYTESTMEKEEHSKLPHKRDEIS